MSTARILVPPGIGDGYWVLVKLRGFLAKHGIERPQVFVHDSEPRRAGEMWQRVPFVDFGGYAPIAPGHPAKTILRRAYRSPGYSVQRRVLGFDYMLSLNGALDRGQTLDRALPGPTNWFEPLTGMEATEQSAQEFRVRFDDYVVAAFWEHGFYRHWLAQFPETAIVETLARLADTGLTVLVMGAAWDKGGISERVAAADPRFVSMVGETDFDALTGLLSGARAVVGFPAGNTILGPYFRTPTVMLWNQHFPRNFWANACPPDGSIYRPLDTAAETPESVAIAMTEMAGEVAA